MNGNLINGQKPEFGNPEHIKWLKEKQLLKEIGETPDEQIMYIVKGFTEEILAGSNTRIMCFAVCYPLSGYLEFCGFKNKLVECEIDNNGQLWQHCFIQLPDGRIIDPTSNQFVNPKTGKPMKRYYFGKKPKWYKELKVK